MATSKKKTLAGDEAPNLVAYRLELVESAVKDLATKFDQQDNIKKSDLTDFKSTLLARITDVTTNLQQQIDTKASAQELKDFKKNVFGLISFASSIVGAVFIWLITSRK